MFVSSDVSHMERDWRDDSSELNELTVISWLFSPLLLSTWILLQVSQEKHSNTIYTIIHCRGYAYILSAFIPLQGGLQLAES